MGMETLEKTMEFAGNAMKLAANMTDKKIEVVNHNTKDPKKLTDDNSNKASTGAQTVVVSMDGKKKDPKPIEKHVHTFPETRPLTTEECELDLDKAKMEYELRKSELEYSIEKDKREWQYHIEQERKNERKGVFRRFIGGVLVALGVGAVGYGVYTGIRDAKNQQNTPTPEPVKAEGTVE